MTHKDEFWNAKPFPHLVIDGLLEPQEVTAVLEEWPVFGWNFFNHKHSHKYARNDRKLFGLHTRKTFEYLNGSEFLARLKGWTGLQVSPDPDLFGGGLHMVPLGGFLDIHVDFNCDSQGRQRALNMILFLNEHWRSEDGGELVLWGEHETVRVEPLANRAVIFQASEDSWHGHPQKLLSKEPRKSLAVYYYVEQTVPEEFRHSTIYRKSSSGVKRQ